MLLFLCSKSIYSPPLSASNAIKIAQSGKGTREDKGVFGVRGFHVQCWVN